MRLEHVIRVPATRARTWALLMDVPAVARCVPGADEITPSGEDRWRGAVRLAVGPVRVRLEGDVALTGRDEEAGRATMRLEAADRAVGGTVRADVRVELRALDGSTEVRFVTEATLAGRIGDLGQPLIKRQADRVISELARCLERSLAAP